MSLRSFTLAAVSALLIFAACDRTDAPAPSGTLALSVTSSNAAALDTLTGGSVSVTGIDGSFQMNVALSAASSGGSVDVSVPAGLYLVAWQPDPLAEPAEATPAASAPRAVVVGPGGKISVALRGVPREGAAVAVSGTAIGSTAIGSAAIGGTATRLALR